MILEKILEWSWVFCLSKFLMSCPLLSKYPFKGFWENEEQLAINNQSAIHFFQEPQILSGDFFLKCEVKASVTPACLTLCYPLNWGPPGSFVHWILQARILESWSEQPFPSRGDLPDPGMNPGLLHCRQILYILRHHSDFLKVVLKLYLEEVCQVMMPIEDLYSLFLFFNALEMKKETKKWFGELELKKKIYSTKCCW